MALAKYLAGINSRRNRSGVDTEMEFEILKCFKVAFSHALGTRDAFERPAIIESIGQSLISPDQQCRKLAAEFLIFFASLDMQAENPQGLGMVLGAFDKMEQQANMAIQNVSSKVGKFDIWISQTNQTIDGRGKMGSRVGAKVDEKSIQEYGVSLHIPKFRQ